MKFKYHTLAAASCFAAMGFASTAQAVPIAGELLELYGNLYPQYQYSNFSDNAVGTPLSTMNAGLATPGVQGLTVGAQNKTQLNWVNSYIGFKGKKSFGDVRAGYDLQGSMKPELNTNSTNSTSATASLFLDTRDAFVYLEHDKLGSLNLGQMDTVYKMFGDRLRMLGVSSSNFVSTSNLVSNVGWKSATSSPPVNGVAGITTFNTRVGGQVLWLSPNWSGVQAGFSFRPDPAKTTAQNQSLTSLGINWSNDTYYIGFGQETHNDYRAFSGTGAVVSGTTVQSLNPRSKDTANRVSVGYKSGPVKLAADLSRLSYTEAATVVGKFTEYVTTGFQVSGEYAVTPQVAVAANFATSGQGTCTLLGGGVCTTTGQGGSLLSLGARYDLDKNIGIFTLYGLNKAKDSASFASSTAGGKVQNLAVGVQVKF
jgi:predicted porin